MDNLKKQRLIAGVIGLLMLFSVAGFAATGFHVTTTADQQNQQQEYSIPSISERLLNSQEKAVILSQGRVIIQAEYGDACESCKEVDQLLRDFIQSNLGFVMLETVQVEGDGFNTLQMIGSGGRITQLTPDDVTEGRLRGIFCEQAVIKPRDCLLDSLEF